MCIKKVYGTQVPGILKVNKKVNGAEEILVAFNICKFIIMCYSSKASDAGK